LPPVTTIVNGGVTFFISVIPGGGGFTVTVTEGPPPAVSIVEIGASHAD
jgi:hypothetical protein